MRRVRLRDCARSSVEETEREERCEFTPYGVLVRVGVSRPIELSAQSAQSGVMRSVARARALRVVTRARSIEEFVETFTPLVHGDTIFVVTSQLRAVGVRQRFLIQLATGPTVLQGEAEVVETCADRNGPTGRNGVRLQILSMDQSSQELFERLHAAERPSELPTMRPAAVPVMMPALSFALRDSIGTGGEPARLPPSDVVLPANPFGELSELALEQFIECTLYEESGEFPAARPTEPLADTALEPGITEPTSTPMDQPVTAGPERSTLAQTLPPRRRSGAALAAAAVSAAVLASAALGLATGFSLGRITPTGTTEPRAPLYSTPPAPARETLSAPMANPLKAETTQPPVTATPDRSASAPAPDTSSEAAQAPEPAAGQTQEPAAQPTEEPGAAETRLVLTSTPPGATFHVNGVPFRSPAVVNAPSDELVEIVAYQNGFAPWWRKIKPHGPKAYVHADFVERGSSPRKEARANSKLRGGVLRKAPF